MASNKKENNKKNDEFGKQVRKNNAGTNKGYGNSIIDEKTKLDIIAVVLIIIGVALFAVALIPTDAPVTSLILNALKFIFGIGIYIFPVALIFLGASFFFKMEKQKIPVRVCIGLSLIFVAVLTIVALSSPTITANRPQNLFDYQNIVNYGGIIGSSLCWIFYTLFGSVVSLILMIGVIVVGLIVVGLSITNIITRIKERRDDIERQREENTRVNNFIGNQANKAPDTNGPNEDMATIAIAANTNKKPGLKTRILGFRDKKNNENDNFSFKPNQNETRVLDDKNAKDKVDKPKEESKKTAVLPPIKSTDATAKKPKKSNTSLSTSTPKPMEGFVLPSFDLLKKPDANKAVVQSEDSLKKTAESLKNTLNDFGINANVVGWVPGPTVTLFKVDLPSGVRVSRITALNDDIALALAAPGVRVFAPIPGTTYVGIEVPNEKRQTVLLSEVLDKAKQGPLQMAIGKDVEGNAVVADLAKMPHLLIGGTTGSGKSVSINAMIMSILMRATPSEVRLILIDPKRVEFTPYNDIPHLYVPVVTEPKEAASALSWGVAEMENRLKKFSEYKVRNISGYNAMVQKMSDSDKLKEGLTELPYIVIVIDELADLMMAVGKEVEFSISRIAQLARAAGIHLIVATQRPSTNVVTGLIKANITSRIAFNVASGIDSRVILDTGGAESLIGLGDLLFNKPEFSKPLRVQGCFVAEDEVNALVEHLKGQGSPEYHNDILKTNLISVDGGNGGNYGGGDGDDSLFWEAAEMVVNAQHGSTSSLQRRFKIGYSRAGRIMDMLEEKGIVGPQNGSKPREVLVDALELEGIKALESADIDDGPVETMDDVVIPSEEPKLDNKKDDLQSKDDNSSTVDKTKKEPAPAIENHKDNFIVSEQNIEDVFIDDDKLENRAEKNFESKQLVEEDIE